MPDTLKRRKDDKFIYRFFGFFYRMFFMLGVAATISVVVVVSTLLQAADFVPPALPKSIVLTYTLKSGLHETQGKPSLSNPLLRPAVTLHEVIDALTQAKDDARVKGLIVKLRDSDLSVAQIQELRAAVHAFRKAGKFAYIYSDSYGGLAPGMGDYYLASAFDKIWVQPVGVVAITGVSTETPFVRGLLDKVGVEAQFSHKGIYKSAPESLTATDMSAPNRMAMTEMVNDLSRQMQADIAKDRGLTAEEMQKLVDDAPYNDDEAKKLKLVDNIGYYDEMYDAALKEGGDLGDKSAVKLLGYSFTNDTVDLKLGMRGFISRYIHKADPDVALENKKKIALIVGEGNIVSFGGSPSLEGTGGMQADKLVDAFDAARTDKDVAAVVFRIDSPGGSPEAAETIRRAVIRVQKAGKPVIVSMSGYAASGGYWVATPADKIVADPGTITGSIGVFGGKFVMQGLWDKLAVNWVSIGAGKNSDMWSANTPFTPEQYKKFDDTLNVIYEGFLQRVMAGRHLTHDQAEAVAEGRVWTGSQAKEKGLVDELGGLNDAVRLAKEAAKIDAKKDVPVVLFPPPKSTLEQFLSLASEGAFARPDIKISAAALLQSLKNDAQTWADRNALRAPVSDIR
ncbi:MAG: signal peptide peptidase SppA [Alphaproteobacteria bacterium]|nr:signal peptide peptidase SppA [Alphaproteobacteria bacterium]